MLGHLFHERLLRLQVPDDRDRAVELAADVAVVGEAARVGEDDVAGADLRLIFFEQLSE